MKTLFWTGKLTLPVMLLVNANNLLAWLNGNSGNKSGISKYMLTQAEENFKALITCASRLISKCLPLCLVHSRSHSEEQS